MENPLSPSSGFSSAAARSRSVARDTNSFPPATAAPPPILLSLDTGTDSSVTDISDLAFVCGMNLGQRRQGGAEAEPRRRVDADY